MDGNNPLEKYLHLIIQDHISPEEGGIQNTAFRLALHLHGRGLRVAVAGRIDRSVFEDRSIDVFSLKKPFRTKYASDLRLLSLLMRLRFKFGRKVILYSLLINNIKVYRWLKPLLGWKCVSFLHGNEMLRLYRRKRATLDRSVRACLCVIANSRFTKDFIQKIRSYPNVIIVPPAISAKLYTNYTGPDFRETENLGKRKIILMLSRLVRRKGHDTVIRAVSRLVSRHPDILLLIAGKGGYRSEIMKKVRERGLEGHVKILGSVTEDEKLSLYRACDVYCMPSETSEEQYDIEGFGMTFIEAAAMGRIVIGSNSGGIPDAIEDSRSGFLIEPGDDERLERLLDDIFSDPGKYEVLRRYARERALRDFNWEKQGDRIIESVGSFLGPAL
jgi:phosphatidylinositol alpha-1,6-mannosyltransferase